MSRRATLAALSLTALAFALPTTIGLAGQRSATTTSAQATIRTIAGTGISGRTGDGGPALDAEIDHPRGLAFLRDGSLVFAEPYLNVVRRIAPDGTITTVAGTGTAGFAGDGSPAVAAELNFVHGVAAMPDGGFVLSDMLNNRIRRVDARGTITTIAGTGRQDFGGDGGPATAGVIQLPRGVATTADGVILIPDSGNNRVRRLDLDGKITTVAGIGLTGGTGDGGSATAAELNQPFSAAPLPNGGFLIADTGGNRIRRVDPDGTITTVAGTGSRGFTADNKPATAVELASPHCVIALPDGGFLIADTFNNRVRRVSPNGIISTVAGTGEAGYSGDGGPADRAALNLPKALALLPSHRGFVIGDALNHRIRLVTIDLRAPLSVQLRASRLSTTTGRNAIFAFTVSRSAVARLSIVRNGTIVARLRRSAPTGTLTWPIGAKLRPASYTLLLKVTTADGITVRSRATLAVTR
jgi:hypothetical protein